MFHHRGSTSITGLSVKLYVYVQQQAHQQLLNSKTEPTHEKKTETCEGGCPRCKHRLSNHINSREKDTPRDTQQQQCGVREAKKAGNRRECPMEMNSSLMNPM